MNPEASSIAAKQFYQSSGTVDEHEDSAAAWIVAEAGDHFGVKSVERFAHVAGFHREKNAQDAGEGQHGRRRVERRSTASGRAAREAISMIEPHGRMTRNSALGQVGCRSATRTSPNAGP